jgi:hypothetical protein
VKVQEMTRDERALLLYLETREVDHSGRVDGRRMNKADHDTAERWNREGFVRFGRIVAADRSEAGCHWCELSDEAFALAHAARKERAMRSRESRPFMTTDDKRREAAAEGGLE